MYRHYTLILCRKVQKIALLIYAPIYSNIYPRFDCYRRYFSTVLARARIQFSFSCSSFDTVPKGHTNQRIIELDCCKALGKQEAKRVAYYVDMLDRCRSRLRLQRSEISLSQSDSSVEEFELSSTLLERYEENEGILMPDTWQSRS